MILFAGFYPTALLLLLVMLLVAAVYHKTMLLLHDPARLFRSYMHRSRPSPKTVLIASHLGKAAHQAAERDYTSFVGAN